MLKKYVMLISLILISLGLIIFINYTNSDISIKTDMIKKNIQIEGMSMKITDRNGKVPNNHEFEITNNNLLGNLTIKNYNNKSNSFRVIFFVDYNQIKSKINNHEEYVHLINIKPNTKITLPFSVALKNNNHSDFLVTIIRETAEQNLPPRAFFLSQRFLIKGYNKKENNNNIQNAYLVENDLNYKELFFLDNNGDIMFNTISKNGIIDSNLFITRPMQLSSIKLIPLLDYQQVTIYNDFMEPFDTVISPDKSNQIIVPLKLKISNDDQKCKFMIIAVYSPFTKNGYDTINSMNFEWSSDCSNILQIN